MSMNRIDRRKRKTRDKIIQAAMLLIDSQGFSETSMERIAEEADIAKGTLYSHFPSKEAIISAYFQQESVSRNLERFKSLPDLPGTSARMRFVFDQLNQGLSGREELFEKFLVFEMQKMVSLNNEKEKSGLYLIAREIIKLGQKEGEIRLDLPDEVLIDLFEMLFIEMVKHFSAGKSDLNVDDLIDLFINGCKIKKK